jgi:type VI secretion system protein ImpF
MAQGDYDVRVTPSLLDRLLDVDYRSPRDVVPLRAEAVREFRRAVQRDLENLLNSRNPHADLPAGFTEAAASVVAYGLPDFTTLNVASAADQQRLRQAIETAVRSFEPRLAAVTTMLMPAAGATDRSLRLRIEAKLLMEPAPEAVSFDVVVPLQTLKCEVKDAS